ncbi:hypothetical protein ACJ41O_008867 [Fusarium nematophilum]
MASPPPYRDYTDDQLAGGPPPYESSAVGSNLPPSAPTGTPIFVLDGSRVVLEQSPDRSLYEFDCTTGGTKICTISKLHHPDSTNAKPRQEHLYDFKETWSDMGGNHVVINGRTIKERSFPEVFLVQPVGSSAHHVAGHFKTSKGVLDRFKNKDQVNWLDAKDKMIAVESKQSSDVDPNRQPLPRLEVKVPLDERELDLLVTCWCAKAWQQAEKPPKEPMSWDKCNCRMPTVVLLEND